MSILFDEAKATQVVSCILKLRGNRMNYLKLIKLLYLVDREALSRWGVSVTTDKHVSMDHGPVVSRIYNLIVEDIPKPQWAEFISPPFGDYEVALVKDASTDALSKAEEELIHEVYEKYGHWNRWDLVKYVHTFPEWKNPQGSSTPIHIRDILKALGESEEEIKATLREMQTMATTEETFSNIR